MRAKDLPTIALVLIQLPLYAQVNDTTEVRNGVFWIFERGRDGRPMGEGMAYDTTGRLVGRETYRKGLSHGQLIWYDGQGRTAWTVPYEKGFRHGVAIQYDSLDRRIHSITYRKGIKHGPEVYYHPNGRIHYELDNRNGQLHGALISLHPNGQIEWTGGFRDGEMHGERILRDSTGALVNGEYVTNYPLARGHYTVSCVNGRPHGKVVGIAVDGQLAYTGNYTDGSPDGEFIFFSPDGSIRRKEYYEKGKYVRSTQRGKRGAHTPDQYGPSLREER
ncbi:MAG: hypothetical protein KDC00_14990 [Flavobacteriales bacterium]|nr:hypothetical protein [Flavobacteriales bacterium]